MSSAKLKITFYDARLEDQTYYRDVFGNEFDLNFCEAPLSADTAHEAAAANVIAVHVSSDVSAESMKLMPHLHHIACRTTGYDNVDLKYAEAHDITVSTVPSYGEDTVAEYAFLLMLAVSRKLMLSAHSVHAGKISPEKLTGRDLNGKTLGIVGTGRIGRHAAGIGRGFGMNVVAFDVYPQENIAKELGFEYVTMDELLAKSDYISLHAPATPETHHLMNADAFAKVKPGVFIVNTSRGTLIETPALIEALNSGQVAGVGLDVLEGEEHLYVQPESNLMGEKLIDSDLRADLGIDVLSKMPNVLITSHNAYNSVEALGRIRETTATNIRAFHAGKPENLIR